MSLFITKILSFPKTLFWNIKWYGLKGMACPILIHYHTHIEVKGKLILPQLFKPFSSKIGFDGSLGIPSHNKQFIYVANNAVLIFKGPFVLSNGGAIRIESSAKVEVGFNFFANKNFLLSCDKSVDIGDNVVIGWNVSIRDSDGHTIVINGHDKQNTKKVSIGNHVWIASEVHVLKGTVIADDSIVGYRSVVIGPFTDSHSLIAGYPAKILQKNISWKI